MTHRVLGFREWTDAEPDTLRIGVEVGEGVEKAFVTFTCTCTWIDYVETRDLVKWVERCAEVAANFNERGYEERYVEVPGHEGRRQWLGNGDFVLACGCEIGCTFLDRGARVDVTKPGPHLRYDPSVDYFQKCVDAGIPITRTATGFKLGGDE